MMMSHFNEFTVSAYFPMKAIDNKFIYNYVNRKLYSAYSFEQSNPFYSSTINQDINLIVTNTDDNNWLNSKIDR